MKDQPTARTLNPWHTNSVLDTCAFDPKYGLEPTAAREIHRLRREEGLPIVLAHSVAKEIDHPNTPVSVKNEARALIFSIPVCLNSNEKVLKKRIHTLITGNGRPERYDQDANHIFEAQKYGSYFITTDQRLLEKASDIRQLCTVTILLPSDFLAVLSAHRKPRT